MTCPVCGGKTTVRNSATDTEIVARKRKCLECKYYFFTMEKEDDDAYDEYMALERERDRKRKSGDRK